jgi:hypothetical protein
MAGEIEEQGGATSGEIDEAVVQAEIDRALAGAAAEQEVPAAPTEQAVPAEEQETDPAEQAADSAEQEPPFLGKWKKDEVAALLDRLEQFDPKALQTQLERSLSGHLGQVGARVKQLEANLAKEFSFDPEALAGVKELDEGLYEKLLEGLQKGLKVQSVDPAALFSPMLEERLTEWDQIQAARTNDAVEERLLLRFVPDAYATVKSPEWATFYAGLAPEKQEALVNWNRVDEEGRKLLGLKNAEPVIQLFEEFRAAQGAKREEEERKTARLQANTRQAKANPRGLAGLAAASRSDEYDPAEAQRVIDEMLRRNN